MPLREDLAYEKRETKVPYILTDADDIDNALEKARLAITDAQSFREYAKETGVDVVRRGISLGMALECFAAGSAACLFVLWCLGVI